MQKYSWLLHLMISGIGATLFMVFGEYAVNATLRMHTTKDYLKEYARDVAKENSDRIMSFLSDNDTFWNGLPHSEIMTTSHFFGLPSLIMISVGAVLMLGVVRWHQSRDTVLSQHITVIATALIYGNASSICITLGSWGALCAFTWLAKLILQGRGRSKSSIPGILKAYNREGDPITIDSTYCDLLSPIATKLRKTLVQTAEGVVMLISEDDILWEKPQFKLQDIPPIPQKFIDGTVKDGGMPEAKRRWRETWRWRCEENIHTILQQPQPKFDWIKECYPHYWCGNSKVGSLIYYEKPGQINLTGLLSNGVDVETLLRYYVFMMEYTYSKLVTAETGPRSKLVTIFDLAGCKFGDFRGHVVAFIKGGANITSAHYPERCQKILIVNSPIFFSMVWKIMKPWICAATREKISIVRAGSDTTTEMLKYIDPNQIPTEYGGTLNNDLSSNKSELEYKRFVHAMNKTHNLNPPYK